MKQLFIFSLLLLFSCSPQQNCPDNINTQPMFGKVKKCTDQIDADKEFLDLCDKFYKTRKDATTHHLDWGWGYFYKNKLDSSMMRFNQAWLLDSTNADVYWGFGATLGKQQKFKESIEYFDRSVKLNPNNEKVWFSIAISNIKLFSESEDITQLEKAIDNLKKSISINKTYAEAFATLTTCYSYYNQLDSAKKYLAITDKLNSQIVAPEIRKLLEN